MVILWAAFLLAVMPAQAQRSTRYTLPRGQSQPGFVTNIGPRNPVPNPLPPLNGLPSATFNVKSFGAVCDGQTDDTTAIQNTYDAAAAAMYKPGGAGIVYFPPSSGYCKVSTLHIPSMGYSQGWLTSLFDNGLLVTGSIFPGNDTAFVGRTSNFMAMSGSFLWGPTAEWQKPKGAAPGPVLDLDGVSQVRFTGIAFANASGNLTGDQAADVVHMHDNNGAGSVTITFEQCSFLGNFVVDTSEPNIFGGFGLHIIDSTISNELELSNYGMVTVRGGYLRKVLMQNTGAVNSGDLEIDDTLSEVLDNEDFLTVDTSGGAGSDITLHRVRIADAVGTAYMVKHINNSPVNWDVNVKFDQIPLGDTASGLIDPNSAPQSLSVICFGWNCADAVNQAKSALYVFQGMTPKGPMILYGSPYVPNPLTIVH